MRVTAVEYTDRDGDVILQVAGRTEANERKIISVEGTYPYIFAPDSERVPDENWIVDVESGYETIFDEPVKKIQMTHPGHVTGRWNDYEDGLRGEFSETYEADIPYYRRASISYGFSGYIEFPDGRSTLDIDEVNTSPETDETISPRVVIGDIEVLVPSDTGIGEMVEKGEQPVTHITLWDSYDEEYTILAYDPGDGSQIDGAEIRDYISGHLGQDHEYLGADMNLRRAGSQEALAEEFVSYIENKRPDLLSGWNWIDFDHEYLLNWIEASTDVNKHRLSDVGAVSGWQTERKIDGLPAFDMMDSFCDQMTFGEWRSKALDYVAGEKLDVGKVPDVNINEEFKTNRTRLTAYNIIDVMLCVELDRSQDIHEFFYQLAELSSVQIYDTHSSMRLVDGYILARRERDEVLPNAGDKDLDSNAGGLVLEPSTGISEWVGVEDLKSLYPSIFITLNISTETLTKDASEADVICPWMPEKEEDVSGGITAQDVEWDIDKGAGMSMDEEGIIPKYLSEIFDERSKFKSIRNQFDVESAEYEVWDNKQNAVKVVMNSFYGVSSNDYWRLAAPEMGDVVTAGARYVIWRGAQISEEMGYDVIYGDTDSIMVSLAEGDVSTESVVENGLAIEKEINDSMSGVADEFGIGGEHPYLADKDLHGTNRHCLTFEFEKLYRRFFQNDSKKRYAGLKVWSEGQHLSEPSPDITGYEAKRSDSAEVTEEVQPEVIKRILNGQTFEEVSEYISSLVERIQSQEADLYKIAKPKSLGQPLEQYSSGSQVFRACTHANEYLGYDWKEHDNPWMYYIDGTPPEVGSTDVLCLDWGDDIPDGYVLDVAKHIEKTIKDPIGPIVGEMNWSFEELRLGRKTQSAMTGDWGVEDTSETDDDDDKQETQTATDDRTSKQTQSEQSDESDDSGGDWW